jgi:hypothetical protein
VRERAASSLATFGRMTDVVPVALFAFRRADLLARALAGLRANAVPLIYAFSDGARSESDAAGVADVRRLLGSVDWAEVRIVERAVNLGLDVSLLTGITAALGGHDEVVICEDDIVMVEGAYAYLRAALEHYRNEPRVMCVNGWTHARVTPPDARDAPHFTGRFGGWGWATWRRAWAGFPETPAARLYADCTARGIDLTRNGRDILDWVTRDPNAVPWDVAFSLHMMLHDGLTLSPARSMTAHIGRDNRASHMPDLTGWDDRPEPPPPLDTIQWPAVGENPAAAALWRHAVDFTPKPSLLRRVRRRLARLLSRGS